MTTETTQLNEQGNNNKPLLYDENFYQRFMIGEERHLIYIHKGKVYQAYKRWTFAHCEEVLTRLGATYWEIG